MYCDHCRRFPSKPRSLPCLRCGASIEQAQAPGRMRLRCVGCKAIRDVRRSAAKRRLRLAAKGPSARSLGRSGNTGSWFWTMGWCANPECRKPFVVHWSQAKTCSRECGDAVAWRRSNDRVYQTSTWKRARKLALQRDEFSCMQCDATNDLVVHHVDRNNENHDLENLETLCRDCHVKEHHGCVS
jgi:5-methylcytosine-specific restriction endonuclease McrA